MSARRTGSVVAGVLSVGAVAAAVTVFNLPDARSGEDPASAPPAATAEVTEETLVDSETHDGTLSHGDTTTVTARTSGTLTGLPTVGSTITRGQAIYRVDNEPVILLYGAMPAYRTLAPGVKGADVKQFEKNLWALGYRGFTVDRTYSSATADAVEQWQDDHGLSETGTVETGRIRYAPAAVRVDSQAAAAGDVVQPGSELLTTTGTARVATVDLEMADQRLAKKGATVEVTLPDDRTVPGRITEVETIVVPGQGEDPDTTQVEVTVGFAGSPAGLDRAAVGVAFTASQRENVLTVPVAALLGLAEGGYGVQVVDDAGSHIVAVETGLFADGKVEVSGDGLTAGAKVGTAA